MKNILVFLALFLSLTLSRLQAQNHKYIDFDLPTISTFNIRLSKIVGEKLVLLTFWTTWCPYCLNEIPSLNSLYEKYSQKGLEIIAVNIKEPLNIVKKYVEKNKIKYNVVLDTTGEVASYYKIKGVPTNFVIDLKGNIIFAAHTLPQEYFIQNRLPSPPMPKNVKTYKKTKTKK